MDVDCYEKRYSDLKGMNESKRTFLKEFTIMNEERNPTCAINLIQYEA